MTSPRHAESTAKGRYYTHPVTGQRLVSVTNAISVGMAKPALVPWAAKVTAEQVAAAITDPDEWEDFLRSHRTVNDWFTKVREARPARLRLIGGSQ